MSYPQVILIAGKKRSGKDHFAGLLANELRKSGKSVTIARFADPGKEIICKSFGISREELDNLKDNAGVVQAGDSAVSMRRFLQEFLTEGMQGTFGPNVWVELMSKKIKECGTDYVLIPDFRFLHEYIWGTTLAVLIETDNQQNDDHISENDIRNFPFDVVIKNYYGKDLSDDVAGVMEALSNVR